MDALGYTPYFTATATAAGVLIGLLFVSVSLRPETIFGHGAEAAGRAQAGSAFTGLVNSLFISLVALIPQAGVGGVSVALAVASAVGTLRLHRELSGQARHPVMLALSLASYLFQLSVGLAIIVSPPSRTLTDCVAYLMIGQIAVALSRAWALLEGRHLVTEPQPDPPAEPAPGITR